MGRFIGMGLLLGKTRTRESCDRAALKRADRGHAFEHLERAPLLWCGIDPLRQNELDFPLELIDAEDNAELALPTLTPHLLGKERQRPGVVEINLHAGVARLGSPVERSELLHAHLDAFAISFGLDVEEHRRARL